MIRESNIRTRIAPSPTGRAHLGIARTALFNYLFAKKHKGIFVLRIEDTDVARSKLEYEKDIMEGLKWLDIKWDEGPDIGGKYGPYRQSERKEIYTKYLKKLLNENKAYYCFCSKEELEAQKQYQLSIKEALRYSGKCASLSKEVVEKYLTEGKPSVIRFRVPPKKVGFEDLIRGYLELDATLLGDFIIAKNIFTPLYNFTCVIDDFEMKISHVIRGEEHISNTPKQILLQEALNFPRVKYAHLPMILGKNRAKLSKRYGAISILDYKRMGYLPEAIINFIAFLGWNPGTEKEIFSKTELIKEFSLEKVQKGGAVFNDEKLDWLNGHYIRKTSIEKLTTLCLPYLINAGFVVEKENIKKQYWIPERNKTVSFRVIREIIRLYRDRLKTLSDIVKFADFFFKDRLEFPRELLFWKNMRKEDLENVLESLEVILTSIKGKDFKKQNLLSVLSKEAINFAKDRFNKNDRGFMLWPLRVALSGKKASPPPFEIAQIIGKRATLKRIKEAYAILLKGKV